MNDKITITLLKIIKDDGDVKKLRFLGLDYRQIVSLIEENITVGNLEDSQNSVALTKKGASLLAENESLIKERDKSKWIQPDFKNKIQKISKEDVYLPSRNEFSFLK